MNLRQLATADRTLATALVLVVLGYAALWPRDLYLFDEGYFLYESVRLLRGDLFYRDFFEINAPLAFYVMAACLKLFGIAFLTGRAVMALLHALIAVMVYATARGLGVRRALAFVAALAHPALAYSVYPQASAHWFAATLTVVLVMLALSRRWRAHTGWIGLTVGLLLATQHHKGIVMGAGVGAVILLDAGLARRSGRSAPPLGAAIGRYVAAIAAVVVPVFGVLLVTAGPAPMFDALVRFPLTGYREFHRNQPWGFHVPMPYGDVAPRLVGWLPLAIGLSLLSGVSTLARRGNAEAARERLVLGGLGGFAVLSIAYNPDGPHLAFIAPVGLIAAAQCGEAAVAWLGRWPVGRMAARALPALLGTAVLALLAGGLYARRIAYPLRVDTALGPIDFAGRAEPLLLDALRERLRDEPLREVFGYPFYATLYLLAEADNPTRFQALKPGYSTPEQIAEAIQALETRRTPYIVVLPYWVTWKTDPVVAYILQHYERVPSAETGVAYPPFVLYHRVR